MTGWLPADPFMVALRVIGFALLAGFVTTVVSFLYRLRVKAEFPEGPTLLVGLGVVAIYLNTRLAFVQFLGQNGAPTTTSEALVNVAVFVAAAATSFAGQSIGNRAAESGRVDWSRFQPDLSPIVRATGRFIEVTLPDEIQDIEGYDPVPDETKQALAGEAYEFPRGLTLTELSTQLVARLKEEHSVGYVDVDLTPDGTVEHIALGQRPTGLGPSLPPGTAAVAVRSDPPFSATPGDTVQIWEQGADPERVGTGELRASVDGSVATIALEESTARRVDDETEHRLMTLSADAYPDREFAALLRQGEETMSVVQISEDSELVGAPVGALELTVIAIKDRDGRVDTIPTRERVFQAGDRVFAIGRPDRLRKLSTADGVQTLRPRDVLRHAARALPWLRREDRAQDRHP